MGLVTPIERPKLVLSDHTHLTEDCVGIELPRNLFLSKESVGDWGIGNLITQRERLSS